MKIQDIRITLRLDMGSVYGDSMKATTEFLMKDPSRLGLPEISTAAHAATILGSAALHKM